MEVITPCGKVFITAFPKENHRQVVYGILSEACGVPVLEAQQEENGRPCFKNLPLDANWTHSGNWCVLAYSFECRVGIDLELGKMRSMSLADRFFNEAEKPKDLPEFYKLWCRKEALFKCAGGRFFEDALRQNVSLNTVGQVHFVDVGVELLNREILKKMENAKEAAILPATSVIALAVQGLTPEGSCECT
ncbi:MAG: 4'-phosphopantetheinyl transferase superfamily protein [Fibrobacteraceae bacterium]|nr:4'-phosphopantetheinyl transferase superfamily protein [Fibrobacteraceae bacterium]MCF0215563.1 4'-phosphopantetheinyl transferase superfamily protein [Fibrobacteraceae bacterium]